MTIEAVTATWAFGLLSGMRHAFEPDHMAAVSTLVSDARDGLGTRRAAWLGAWWGMGHTIALLAVGLGLGVLRAGLPARVEEGLELIVALMLIGLGARAMRRAIGRPGTAGGPLHRHGGRPHAHAAPAPHVHVGSFIVSPRSFLVGVIHGLAGSGALVALAMAELSTATARLLYVGLFGLGSVVSMAMVTGLAGWQLSRLAARPAVQGRIQLAAGALSLGVGLIWAWPMVSRVWS